MDILIVEDKKELGEILKDFLLKENYSVTLSLTGEDALMRLNERNYKLVILDIMLPDIDGFQICANIRKNNNTPILIVSAKTSKEDKLNGLILGADDYIEKPYDIDILLAKIKGIFQRKYGNIISVGNIVIDKTKKQAYCDRKVLNLTIKEFELLELFLENKGQALKKEWIFNKIWGFDNYSEMQTLTVHVNWLREKIEIDPKKPTHIITVWGIGYRFEE